jgi:magnesium transporter
MTHVTQSDIQSAIERRDWTTIRAESAARTDAEVLDLLRELPPSTRPVVFRLLPRDTSAIVFALMTAEEQHSLLQELSSEETSELLSDLSPDDRTHLLEELPGRVTQRLLNLLSPEDLREARQLLGYPSESVGRLMTPDYIAVRPDWSLQQALDHLREMAQSSETIDVLYVVDRDWRLLDELNIKRFLLAPPGSTVESIMDHTFAALNASDDREMAVRMMERHDISVLPVIDPDGILVGIVTFDDVMDVAAAEVTEDFHRTAGVEPIVGSYRDARPWMLYRKRVVWLLLLVFMNIFSGAAIASFEDTIATAVALVFFLPLLIDSAGNAGSQSATLMIRAIAVGDVRLGDWGRLLGKEIGIALSLGLTMAFAVSWLGVLRGGTDVAIVVAMTMVLVVVIGSMIGTLLPFVLSRLKLDPAAASAPLVTSLADISGVLIYFSIATWWLDVT